MELLRIIGIVLLVLSAISGITIYIFSFIDDVKFGTISFLFVISLLTGATVYSIGLENTEGIFYASAILLILAGLSAVTLFLSVINIVTCNRTNILWIFFLTGISIGTLGILATSVNF